MNRDPRPYPPQMRNGGSPPAHLSSSSLSDPSGWLQYKWSQPPPRAPEWVIDDYLKFNPPANVGCPLHDEEWLQQALREVQQAAGLLPPKSLGGPILLGAHARAECAYQDWKWTVDALWEDERHRLQTAARQSANAILTSKLLTNNRRQLIANASSTSVLPRNARRPIVANDC
jgi:hypothetical protein